MATMMTSELYENGYQLVSKAKSPWGRVDDANGKIVYEGTYVGAQAWLRNRSTLPLSAGTTREERQARSRR